MKKNNLGNETMLLYKKIDHKIEDHFQHASKKAPCSKGCASCCSQFFEVSEAEYMVIVYHLRDWDKKQLDHLLEKVEVYRQVLSMKHESFYNTYFSSTVKPDLERFYYRSNERYKIHLPCVFLSEEGACTIYEGRPFVCRTTGVGYKNNWEWGSICRELRSTFLARRWQADLREFREDILICQNTDDNMLHQYPIYYHLYDSFIKNNLGFADPRLVSYFS